MRSKGEPLFELAIAVFLQDSQWLQSLRNSSSEWFPGFKHSFTVQGKNKLLDMGSKPNLLQQNFRT